ncbi:hypothetical protein BDM02DRAFT_2864585 [Thelephora ganbajun]|uniref:Uncharacterized protein n=1 Tax=Thelephora ganbajun TaxID=370292 RepID=A0ACB6ZBL2_THEGA|nr:hypothetical protein BDM02DRAFT_2864585 [Thelephora ganbajun]
MRFADPPRKTEGSVERWTSLDNSPSTLVSNAVDVRRVCFPTLRTQRQTTNDSEALRLCSLSPLSRTFPHISSSRVSLSSIAGHRQCQGSPSKPRPVEPGDLTVRMTGLISRSAHSVRACRYRHPPPRFLTRRYYAVSSYRQPPTVARTHPAVLDLKRGPTKLIDIIYHQPPHSHHNASPSPCLRLAVSRAGEPAQPRDSYLQFQLRK